MLEMDSDHKKCWGKFPKSPISIKPIFGPVGDEYDPTRFKICLQHQKIVTISKTPTSPIPFSQSLKYILCLVFSDSSVQLF